MQTNDGEDWTDFNSNKGGAVGLRVDLDTTGGTGNWTASFFAKENELDAWTQVRSATALTNEDIDSIGFSSFRSTTSYSVESFTVTQIPEPSSILLVVVLGGLLFRSDFPVTRVRQGFLSP